MRRIESKAVLLKRRVKTVQTKAIFAGLLYLIGLIALTALAAIFPTVKGAAINGNKALPILEFYRPLVTLFKNLKSLTVEIVIDATVALAYVAMMLVMVIGIVSACTKLGWLFKRRASYANGFNRNAYAMDYIANRFASAFAAFVCVGLITYLFTAGAKLDTFAYVTLGVGFVFHFGAGVLGGTVTTFTAVNHVEEEEREHGVLVYFIRNVIQVIVVTLLIVFMMKETVIVAYLKEVLDKLLVSKTAFAAADYKEMIYPAIELVLWVFIMILATHATAETEYNRDCMYGVGMRNFVIFSMLSFVAAVAMIAVCFAGLSPAAAESLNVNYLIIAGISLVAFILDLVVRSYQRGTYDEVEVEDYIRDGNPMQYNY